MRKIICKPIYTAVLFFFLFLTSVNAQFEIQIIVDSGSVTTTCTDFLSDPEPIMSVNIGGTGWVSYDPNDAMPDSCDGNTISEFPNTQWIQQYPCLSDVPPQIEICVRFFENDPVVAFPPDPCDIEEDCMVEICGFYALPPFGGGSSCLDNIGSGAASEGEVCFSILNTGPPCGINDLPCGAIPLGTFGNPVNPYQLGFPDLSIFCNHCATNTGEPGSGTPNWVNDGGTWFTFTTGNIVGSAIAINGFSDPENIGDPVNLQIALYEADNCAGPFTWIDASLGQGGFDESLVITCPQLQPNQDYYILVDGSSNGPGEQEGLFGLEVVDLESVQSPDTLCQADELGTVPEGGFLEALLQSNFCASNFDDPPVMGFGSQTTVWFTFNPPSSGHVEVEALGNTSANLPLDIQMAVFELVGPNCFGPFTQVSDGLDQPGLDAVTELSCLDPDKTYYIMIDGAANQNNEGMFDLTITDLGDNTPVFDQTLVLCFGECVDVGSVTYCDNIVTSDTLTLPSGCDSIVNTDLTILSELIIDYTIGQDALGLGMGGGTATASAMGSLPDYEFIWSDGQMGPTANNLIGGDNYCVTVIDDNDCEAEICFDMPYIENFVTLLETDTVDCNGDSDGVILITAFAGVPPYTFDWEKTDLSLTGNGTIPNDNDLIPIPGLTAGTYSISITDTHFDTVFMIDVAEPDPVGFQIQDIQDVSCFGLNDGVITLQGTGGTAPYNFTWGPGIVDPMNLSAGFYMVTITDANQCEGVFDFTVKEPDEFIATCAVINNVSCFQGSNGQAIVTTNGNPILWEWDDPAVTQTADINDLPAGMYNVTVTNDNMCTATCSVTITEPSEAVCVDIEIIQNITCNGDSDAILEATPCGPGISFGYNWSNMGTGSTLPNVGPGDFTVTVTNDAGCTAEATVNVTEPDIIEATYSTKGVTCIDGKENGMILIENVTGGYSPYVYSLDGINYFSSPVIDGLSGGNYNIHIQDDGGCVEIFNTFVEGVPNLSFDLGPDLDVLLGDSIILDATPVTDIANLSYSWEPAALFPCQDCPVNGFFPTNATTVSVNILDEETNCTYSDEIFIDVNRMRRVYIPNVFSPNDDGINDFFTIYGGNDVALVRTLKIFDRFGTMIFEADNFLPEATNGRWYGRFNGDKLNPAVFVYFAEILFIDGETELFRGDITLMK